MNTTTKPPDLYFTLATAGHVDHGKTSLIKALTGTNPDRLKEEQERQMTTDLGFAHLILPAADGVGAANQVTFGLGFIDVPGHGKFLKNMLAGVGGIELALLVVAADEGPMPQTVQHIKILSLLGVRNAVVALTKADLADAARCAEVETKVRVLLERFNISILGLQCVSAVKGENGQGITELKKTLARALAQVKNHSSSGTAAADGALKAGYLPIDRVFAKSGYGTVVTGTLVEGYFNVGDQVTIEPGGVGARIRGLETFGKALDQARSGQRLAINLSAKDHKLNLSRGLCVLGGTKNITADLFLQIFDFGAENDLEQGASQKYKLSPKPIKLYHGTMEAAGALRWMEKLPTSSEAQGLNKANVQSLQNIGHVHLSDAIVVNPGDRYVLRYGDDGIAGGAVLLCQKPRWLTRKLLAELAPFLIDGDYDRALRFILDCHPSKALHQEQLGWVVRNELLDDCLERLQKSGAVENLSGFFMATAVKEAIKQKTVTTLNSLLKSEEAKANGVNLETVRGLVAPHLDRKVMQELIKDLSQASLLVRKDDKLFGPSGGQAPSANLDPYTESILKHLDEVLCLELTELARLTNSDAKKVKLAVERLAKLNMAQVINYDFASSKKWVDHAYDKLVKIWQGKKGHQPG